VLVLLMKMLPLWEYRKLKAPQGVGGECVDLAVLWCQALGLPRVWGNASAWTQVYDPHYWYRTRNLPANNPPPGALVVWHEYPVLDISAAGHIAICVQSTADRLVTLDQNWPVGAPCRLNSHGYGGVDGWLTPIPPKPVNPR
jgi:hypothetical protein